MENTYERYVASHWTNHISSRLYELFTYKSYGVTPEWAHIRVDELFKLRDFFLDVK